MLRKAYCFNTSETSYFLKHNAAAQSVRTAQVMAAAQALLASDLSSDLNNLVAAST